MPEKKSAQRSARTPYQPDERDREAVELMVGYGIPLEEIRQVVVNPATGRAVSKATLVRRFRKEIDAGMVRANSKVAESLYLQAIGRAKVTVDGEVLQEERAPNTSAAIWWTKARMGWRASGEGEAGADGEQQARDGGVVVYIPDNGREGGERKETKGESKAGAGRKKPSRKKRAVKKPGARKAGVKKPAGKQGKVESAEAGSGEAGAAGPGGTADGLPLEPS